MLELNLAPVPELRSERLLLRPIAAGDLQALFALRSDPRVMRYIGRPIAKTIEDAAKLLAVMQESLLAGTGIVWAITRIGDDEMVGTIGFWRIAAEHHSGELGYILRPDLWGRGYTKEAASAVLEHGFGRLGFHRVDAHVDPANAGSIGVLEALGFAREAHFRQNYCFDGAFLDTLVYGLLTPGARPAAALRPRPS